MNVMNSGNSIKIDNNHTKKDNCYEKSNINSGCLNNINVIAIKTRAVKQKDKIQQNNIHKVISSKFIAQWLVVSGFRVHGLVV